MRKIPENLKEEILKDDYYKKCARKKTTLPRIST